MNAYPLTEEGVRRALADLDKGGSEDVAIRLAELGFKGQRDNDCGCPVANYLGAVVADVEYVMVGGESAHLTGIVREELDGGFLQSWDVRFHATLPDSVSAFVEDFDAGVFPELIEAPQTVEEDDRG